MRKVLTIALLLILGWSSKADHPNAGSVPLSNLISDGLKNNIEIKEAEKLYSASIASRKQAISPFLPSLGVEGGYQISKVDSTESNATFVYGIARLNLYRGGRDQAQSDIQGEEERFKKIKLEQTKARVEREISKKYYELLYLQEGIALKEDALRANREQNKLAIKKQSAGFTSQADVLEFELREATLNSDLNMLKREETVKERELNLLLNRTNGAFLRVGGHLHRQTFNKNLSGLLELALQRREDLKEAEKNAVVVSLQYKSLFGEYLPRLDLEARYGKLAGEERVFDNINNYTMMLKASIPIFSGLETAYGRQAKSDEIARHEHSLSRKRQEIKIQLDNLLTKLKSIEERLNLEEKNVERSKNYYNITVSEYKKGVKNSPDVAGAAERLFDSRLRNLEFRKEFFLTTLEIAEAVGAYGQEVIPSTP